MSVTGGLNWWEVQELLLEISVHYALAFCLFILVTYLAVMNVITGIFVTDAVEMARMDADIKVQQATEERPHVPAESERTLSSDGHESHR